MDIHYPKIFHDRDFEFPILCDQAIPLCDKNKTKKLMSTFYDKKNYTISLHMLKYCLEKGLKLKKIHYVIYTEQSDYMKKDKVGVELFQLVSNSNFGKQIENVTKYKDTRIVNNADKAKKIVSKVTLNNWHVLSEFFTLYEMKKSTVLLDKPIIIGFTILEIAKLEMNIHYDRLKE